MEIKRGGKRKNAGAKPKYNEQTKTVAFHCPLSKVAEFSENFPFEFGAVCG